jgi:transposase-like protein
MDSSTPFEPTPEGLHAWLLKLPPTTREALATFLASGAARSTAAAVIDQIIAEQVETSTYEKVARRHGCTKYNITRRVTRHRNRERAARERAARETAEPTPEPHSAANMAASATQTPAPGPNRERQRQPAFLAP